MKYFPLLFIAGCCFGCSDSSQLTALKESLRVSGEHVAVKQDESLTILRENTTALAAIKSQVESLSGSLVETRQALGTMEASLVRSNPNGKESDPASALEPQKTATANGPQPSKPVALSPAVRLKWNVEGNWNPTYQQTADHLRDDHGVKVDGMTHQEMHDLHASIHDGKTVATKAKPVVLVNRGTSCPGGVCPTARPVRRGLFGRRR
jgi:hypothetical protein